jgi:hypothetical protein
MTMNRVHCVQMALFSLMLAGCVASVETLDGTRHRITSDAFRGYAEHVFREQNRVASDLAFRMEDEQLAPKDLDLLEQAEARLLEDCRDLNEVAVRRRDGERRRPLADTRAARTVPGCERAVEAVGRMLAAPNRE